MKSKKNSIHYIEMLSQKLNTIVFKAIISLTNMYIYE